MARVEQRIATARRLAGKRSRPRGTRQGLCESLRPLAGHAGRQAPAHVAGRVGRTDGCPLDNLDRVERLGWIETTDTWLTIRQLRNQMVHEYIEDTLILACALQSGHEFVASLSRAAAAMLRQLDGRGWL